MNVQYGDQIHVEDFDRDDEMQLTIQYTSGNRYPVWLSRAQVKDLIKMLEDKVRDEYDGISKA